MNALRLPNTLLDFTSKLGSSQEMAPPSDTAAPTRDPPGTWGPSLSLHLHILFQKRRNSQRARPVHTLCVCIKSNSQSCRWISANSLPPALPILQGTSALLAFSSRNTDTFTPRNTVLFHQPLCPHSIPGHNWPLTLTAAPRRCLLPQPSVSPTSLFPSHNAQFCVHLLICLSVSATRISAA